MRKAYNKPVVYVEQLGIHTAIATACTVKITGPITGATYDDGADIIFGAGPNGQLIEDCTVGMNDPEVQEFCYNAPIDASMVFQS